MASNNRIFSRWWWPVLVIAVALAERAHAPFIGFSLASVSPGGTAKAVTGVKQKSQAKEPKINPDSFLPLEVARVDPDKIQQRFRELEPVLSDPLLPWSLDPADNPRPSVTHDTFPIVEDPVLRSGDTGDLPSVDPTPPPSNGIASRGGSDVPTNPITQGGLTPVPEPTSVLLMLSTGALLLRRRAV